MKLNATDKVNSIDVVSLMSVSHVNSAEDSRLESFDKQFQQKINESKEQTDTAEAVIKSEKKYAHETVTQDIKVDSAEKTKPANTNGTEKVQQEQNPQEQNQTNKANTDSSKALKAEPQNLENLPKTEYDAATKNGFQLKGDTLQNLLLTAKNAAPLSKEELAVMLDAAKGKRVQQQMTAASFENSEKPWQIPVKSLDLKNMEQLSREKMVQNSEMKQKMMTTENESMTSTLNEKNLSVQQEINRAGIEESNNPKLRQELFSTPKEAGFFVESKAPVVTNQSELVPKEVMSSRLQQWIDVSQKIIGTIENGFKVLLNQGDNKISIRLYPPELGKVEIEVAVKGNQVNARILTENQAVKEVVLGNLEQLRSSIQNLEYNIQKIEVELGSFKNGFEHRSANEPDSQGQSSGNRQHPDNSNLYLTSFKDAAEVIWERQPFSSFQGLQVNLLI